MKPSLVAPKRTGKNKGKTLTVAQNQKVGKNTSPDGSTKEEKQRSNTIQTSKTYGRAGLLSNKHEQTDRPPHGNGAPTVTPTTRNTMQ